MQTLLFELFPEHRIGVVINLDISCDSNDWRLLPLLFKSWRDAADYIQDLTIISKDFYFASAAICPRAGRFRLVCEQHYFHTTPPPPISWEDVARLKDYPVVFHLPE